MNILSEIWFLLCEMSPFLLLGFMLAGLMHEFVPNTLYTRYLGKPSFRSVVLAALFGVPLPLCSCGVIPTAMGIRREGASKGATISFLIATPQTGVDSIIATYSLMGLPFAVIRPVVALLTAIFGGTLCNALDNDNVDDNLNLNANHNGDKKPTSSSKRLRRAFAYAFGEMMEDIGKWLA
ncbi:MAG: permease, partial [Bacteroidaceae bacterium]|nr:permease [Bacteroidaceae bacterium]